MTQTASYKMMCFCCNKDIQIGDEITKCIENRGMNLRNSRSSSARWVHKFCLPKDVKTEFFWETYNELQDYYPTCCFEEICDMIYNHDYFTIEGEVNDISVDSKNDVESIDLTLDDEPIDLTLESEDDDSDDESMDSEGKEFHRIVDEALEIIKNSKNPLPDDSKVFTNIDAALKIVEKKLTRTTLNIADYETDVDEGF